ncbi:MAG: YciI family protein [Terriglobales bacterium]
MQFLLLIYDNEKRYAQGYDPAELGKYQTFGAEHAASIKGGNALQATSAAVTVRVRNGKPVNTDGPFAETKEQLGGYYLVEAPDRAAAAAIAAKIPGALFGSIEVRPIMTFSKP